MKDPIYLNKQMSSWSGWKQVFVIRHAKLDLMGISKSIDPGQSAQLGQADHGRNFSLLADFSVY